MTEQHKDTKGTQENLADRHLPTHPFKRNLVKCGYAEHPLVFDLSAVVENSRTCPINTYVKLREEDAMFDKLSNADGLILQGIWRMGKTEMLATMFSRKDLLDRCISVNLQQQPNSALVRMETNDFAMNLAKEQVIEMIAKYRFLSDAHPEDTDYPEIVKAVSAEVEENIKKGISPLELLNSKVKPERGPVFIVFDEIIILAHDDDKIKILADISKLEHIKPVYVLQKHPRNVDKFLDQLPELPRHFVEALDFSDTNRIANALLSGTIYNFNPSGILAIHSWSGGMPFMATGVSHIVIEAIDKGLISDHSIGAEHVDSVMNSLAAYAGTRYWDRVARTVLEPAISNFFKLFNVGLSSEEAELLDKLALSGPVAVSQFDANMIAELENLRLVHIHTVEGDTNLQVDIRGKLFKRFILDRERISDYNPYARDEYGNDYV